MVTNKHISKFIVVLMAVAIALCLLSILFSGQLNAALGQKGVAMDYESALFDTDKIIQIDIQMEEDSWQNMLENAIAEEYVSCDVTVNGQTFYSVAIRPKGNTSLSSIAMDPTTDRYSLKLEFDHYVSGQTCYGLDKLILNNNYADATNMKEAIVYDMYRYLDADASLYNYAELSVNGEYIGIYLALEAVEDSFILRNYGTEDGNLYKPETMDGGNQQDMGRDKMPDMGNPPAKFDGEAQPDGSESSSDMGNMQNVPDNFGNDGQPGSSNGFPDTGNRENPPVAFGNDDLPYANSSGPSSGDMENLPSDLPDKGEFPGGGFSDKTKDGMPGGFSMNGNGGDLNYTDDDLDSYSTIWDGEISKTSKSDRRRVVTALKNISEANNLEKYLNVDNILKYMAVHTFSVNMDSLLGTMAHNYYLYEYNGQLNILPWDYNLSFGGMTMGAASGASGMINYAIDTPFQGTRFFDALLENETYLARYHDYLRQLTEEYVSGGKFEETYTRIRSQIDDLVNTDPTAFYTYEEYDAGARMLYRTIQLRAESIQGQLNGSIPSTDVGQKEDSSSLIDTADIDIDTMGVFNGGGNRDGNMGGNMPESFSQPPTSADFPSTQYTSNDRIQNIIAFAIYFVIMVVALAIVKLRPEI